nr:Lrp/AsnC family transcriptional regulator [Candidatus Sigynarchaeota archaeon]
MTEETQDAKPAVSKSSLDDLDRQILAMLKEDSSKSFKEIADSVGKTEATVRRRVKRMRDEEYIKKFTIVLNDKKISEKKVKATIKIVPELKASKQIAKKVSSLAMVNEAYLLSGECGILIKVAAESVEALTDFIENEIGSIQGVRSIDTCFIMKVLKEEM